ncbi:hypothetical protein C1H46_013570 [Malus baccata]|uniref:Uncharacterized protein n=1 Tax=Malus baccata TaxID=106549 RepID=A0A540MPT2_MALBA|nr:hypothetical protein C1H46_013570 [Malus baccata]
MKIEIERETKKAETAYENKNQDKETNKALPADCAPPADWAPVREETDKGLERSGLEPELNNWSSMEIRDRATDLLDEARGGALSGATDRVLVTVANGTTLWSRAIRLCRKNSGSEPVGSRLPEDVIVANLGREPFPGEGWSLAFLSFSSSDEGLIISFVNLT